MPLDPFDRRHLDVLRFQRAQLVLELARWRRIGSTDAAVEALHAAQLTVLQARITELEAQL